MSKKEDSWAKKRAAYMALVASMIAQTEPADSQVIYTDVNPDETIYSGWWNLDLNNDGEVDYHVYQSSSYSSYNGMSNDFSLESSIFPLNNNLVQRAVAINFPAQLEYGDTIGPSKEFMEGGPLHSHWNFNHAYGGPYGSGSGGHGGAGVWNSGIHYLGLKLEKEGNNYYGWARVSIKDLTVYDYAINSKPNKPVFAGKWDTQIVFVPLDNVILYVDQKQLHFSDKLNQYLLGNINVYDLMGRLVFTKPIDNQKEIISLEDFNTGIYVAEVIKEKTLSMKEDRVTTLKFFLKN
jgi:hypothetical protein